MTGVGPARERKKEREGKREKEKEKTEAFVREGEGGREKGSDLCEQESTAEWERTTERGREGTKDWTVPSMPPERGGGLLHQYNTQHCSKHPYTHHATGYITLSDETSHHLPRKPDRLKPVLFSDVSLPPLLCWLDLPLLLHMTQELPFLVPVIANSRDQVIECYTSQLRKKEGK